MHEVPGQRGQGGRAIADETVTVTAPGSWPGTDAAEAIRILRGQLGEPHLPVLPQLPGRGVGSDPVGRTAAMLVELPVDTVPHGWRLVDRPGLDHRRAESILAGDINLLADIVGADSIPGPRLKVQIRGPWSMAANLYLHSGERALLDVGARRDVWESLAAGLAGHLEAVRAVSGGAELVLEVEEPEIAAVLAGTIPTSSGYRTLRAIRDHEVRAAWTRLADAAHDQGVREVVVSTAASQAPLALTREAGFDGVSLRGRPANELSMTHWESIAAAVEAGRRIWLGIGEATPSSARARAEPVLRRWNELGLDPRLLRNVRLTPAGDLSDGSVAAARATLSGLTQVAEVLGDFAAQ